jgi:hypothetical protein
VDVQVKELNPGKVFSITASFPQGFEAGADVPTEFSVKTTHPKYPLLKAPVVQAHQPAVTPVVNPGAAGFSAPLPPPPSTKPAAH